MSSGLKLQVKGCKPVCLATTFSLHSGKSCTFTADHESLCDKLAQVNLLAQLGMHGCDAMRRYIHLLNHQIMCWAVEVYPNHVKMESTSSQHVAIPHFLSGQSSDGTSQSLLHLYSAHVCMMQSLFCHQRKL